MARWRSVTALVLLVGLLTACTLRDGQAVQPGGPLASDTPVSSSWVASPGTEFGWGLVILRSPDDREFTVSAARAVTDDPEASLEPAYALGPRRTQGGMQILKHWPPKNPTLNATPTRLPVTVPPARAPGGDMGVEILVGIVVPNEGTTMTGVEVTYTDGEVTWRDVLPQQLRVCSSGTLKNCPAPQL